MSLIIGFTALINRLPDLYALRTLRFELKRTEI
jgi:hypothetical protein